MADDPQLDPNLIAAVKGFEGFAPQASWDYKQYTNGYGTKATAPGETIDRDTAEQRLQAELLKAQAAASAVNPSAPPGVQNALTSLTFNAGPGWANSGLGDAVRAGDWDTARQHFVQYNKAGGQVNPGLVSRRAAEAAWFDAAPPAPGAPLIAPQMPSQLAQSAQLAQPSAQSAQPSPLSAQGIGQLQGALRPFLGGAGGGGQAGADMASLQPPPALQFQLPPAWRPAVRGAIRPPFLGRG